MSLISIPTPLYESLSGLVEPAVRGVPRDGSGDRRERKESLTV